MITFSAETKGKAESLLEDLFKNQLVADAQIINSNYERMYMKYNKQQLNTDLVKVKMFTASYRVPELVKYVKEHNPNEHTTDVAPDIVATELTAGSSEYIDWVKKQVKEGKSIEDNSELQLSSDINLKQHKRVHRQTRKVSRKHHH